MGYSSKQKLALGGVVLTALVGLGWGWQLFWFLCDDAFIAFRYISNRQLGLGYVWNAPPFRPVEGYTSFLWIVLLDAISSLTGTAIPAIANTIALGFASLTLGIGSAMILRMALRENVQRWRIGLLGLVLLGTLSNRTFLAWTSSGLETAMFNCCLTLWIYWLLFLPFASRRWLIGSSLAATLTYLTRPDGMLVAGSLLGLVGLAFYHRHRNSILRFSDLILVGPLGLIPAHLLWRHATYGEWLPNTYYAKTLSGRTQAELGSIYGLSFIIEYSLWGWLLILVGLMILRCSGFVRERRRPLLLSVGIWQLLSAPDRSLRKIPAMDQPGLRVIWIMGATGLLGLGLWLSSRPIGGAILLGAALLLVVTLGILELSLLQAVVIGILSAHTAYYTWIIGGDHFEYRVYSHLILLLLISALWMLNAMHIRTRGTILALTIWIVLSWPIPWTHWRLSQAYTTRKTTGFLKIAVADELRSRLPGLPDSVYRYIQWYDQLQVHLIDRAVGMRHQEHKVFQHYLASALPSREAGLALPANEYPVLVTSSVGVVGWVFPRVNILDTVGLNDYVIARNPATRPAGLMAHERQPPAGYIECFRPNRTFTSFEPRATPLTTQQIIACEQHYAKLVRTMSR